MAQVLTFTDNPQGLYQLFHYTGDVSLLSYEFARSRVLAPVPRFTGGLSSSAFHPGQKVCSIPLE